MFSKRGPWCYDKTISLTVYFNVCYFDGHSECFSVSESIHAAHWYGGSCNIHVHSVHLLLNLSTFRIDICFGVVQNFLFGQKCIFSSNFTVHSQNTSHTHALFTWYVTTQQTVPDVNTCTSSAHNSQYPTHVCYGPKSNDFEVCFEFSFKR